MEALIAEAMKVMPLGQALVLVFLYFIIKTIREVRDSIITMNGTVREMKVWQDSHEKQDDERHDLIMTQLERVQP